MKAASGVHKTEIRRQNETRLAGLYEEYYDRIARYVHLHTGDRMVAQDLAGETFLRALDSLDSYQERGVPLQAWLFRIAHNLVVDHFRKSKKMVQVPLDTETVDSGEDPVDVAEQNIELERMNRAMEGLTPEQRAVIGLRFMAGLPSKETARILNKSDGAVREMQRAAIENLRKRLTPEGRGDSHD